MEPIDRTALLKDIQPNDDFVQVILKIAAAPIIDAMLVSKVEK